jgi:hypothetical protein
MARGNNCPSLAAHNSATERHVRPIAACGARHSSAVGSGRQLDFYGGLRCGHELGLRDARVVEPAIAIPGDVIMRMSLLIERSHLKRRASVGKALAPLLKAWASHTLKRVIADVAATSDRDYGEFGLDKAEMLAALRQLHDEIASEEGSTSRRSCRDDDGRLAVVVTKRKAGVLANL